MKIIIFFIVSLLVISVTVCTSSHKKSDELLSDTWTLESIGGESYNPDSGDGQHPVIEINLEEEKLTGNTGCNSMNGKVKVDGSKITFSEIVTTKMFCIDSIEQEFLITIGKVNNYKIEKMRLFLFEDDTEMMILKKID